MIKSIKIRLLPTKGQEIMMNKSVGVARFSFNYGLAKWEEMHTNGEKPTAFTIKKIFNNTIKKEEYIWLKEVGNSVTAQAFEDLQKLLITSLIGEISIQDLKLRRNLKGLSMLDMIE